MAVKLAASCGVIGLLLVAWILLAPDNESPSDLATAPESTTSTTTEAVAPTAAKSLSEPVAAEIPATNVPDSSDDRVPGHPTIGIERGSGVATEAETETETATPAPAPTSAPATGPAPVSIGRPSCSSGLGAQSTQTAPFTGLTSSIHAGMPAVVVKVSNNSSASRRSLIGLDQADIVFEERIEASATRFFSVFHSNLPPNVGPVRSGRTSDLQLTLNLNQPVFAYSGSNDGVARQIKFAADNGILVPFVNTDSAPFIRDGRYSAPDNLFVDPAGLGACGGAKSPTAIFSYGGASSTTASPASSVSLSARSSYRFDWDGSHWVRSQDGTTHTTREGIALAPKNVVVMFVAYLPSEIDSQSVDAQTVGSGTAWIFRDGTATEGSWTRTRGGQQYSLTDGNGAAVNLAPGQTWVVLAPEGTASYG